MAQHEWAKGDVAQIDPQNGTNPMFAACFLTVTEVRGWGLIGYVQALGDNGIPGGQAYIRLTFDQVEYVGQALWVQP